MQEPSLDLYDLENEGVVPGLNHGEVHENGCVGAGGGVEQGGGAPGGKVDEGAFGNWSDAGAWTLVADEVKVVT